MSAADKPDQTTSPVLDQARRHRAGVRDASADLERALAAPVVADEPWKANVAGKLAALSDAFVLHVAAAEAGDGVLAESVIVNPRLAHRTDMLRRDHVEITAMLAALGHELAGADDGPAPESSSQIRSDALAILTKISQHRHIGADLVYQAYMVDIEAAD